MALGMGAAGWAARGTVGLAINMYLLYVRKLTVDCKNAETKAAYIKGPYILPCSASSMKALEPVVNFVGQLSFRNKLRVTALVFGLPLLAVTAALLIAINARVSALEHERAALSAQVPLLSLVAALHQYTAASLGLQEGAEELRTVVEMKRQEALRLLQALRAHEIFQGERTDSSSAAGEFWLGRWNALAERITTGDAQAISELIVNLRAEQDRLNERSGLLSDGDTASGRLLDVMTAHLPGLLESTGQASQIGTVVLVKKSVRGSRRIDLTLHRGNFDALVLWSIESLRKVAQERPQIAGGLDAAGSRLNTAFAAMQEAITIKMLDTTDFAMAPSDYLAVADKAFAETLAVGNALVEATDSLLADRLAVLTMQRNVIVLIIAVTLALVLAGFFAAYISIMRGLNGLSDAVETMAAGNLDARVQVTSRDELGEVGERFNEMAGRLAERTAQLREKTNDIHSMLQNLPQGILTIVEGGKVHAEYSRFLEIILEQHDLAGQPVLELLFAGTEVGTDTLNQVGEAINACLGEDRMNFDFNSHLLIGEVCKQMAGGRVKILELLWAPICDDSDVVDKVMVCVRDVTELRALAAEAEHQKRELEMVGQILKINQEKFHEFIDSSRRFLLENKQLLQDAGRMQPELVTQLFRNMHTIKGNARTYGLLHLTNLVHEAEQAYEALRRPGAGEFDKSALLAQLAEVSASVEEYAHTNDVVLGRKGPGRRGSAEKYLMVERGQFDELRTQLDAYDLHGCTQETLAAVLEQVRLDLHLVGTDSLPNILEGVFESLPSLAAELGKAAPELAVEDAGIRLRNQVSDLMRNVFMHLYRNALDHGVELPAERLAQSKSAAGRICLSASLAADLLTLRLADDGRGLALHKIRAKAEERGMLTAGQVIADESLANLIFAPGFSTATAVTEISGRGVGMDAVQSFVKREGGQIRLQLLDDRDGADYRAFATVIELPARFAVDSVLPAKSVGASPRRAGTRDGERVSHDIPGLNLNPVVS